jgi:hypothetical protein
MYLSFISSNFEDINESPLTTVGGVVTVSGEITVNQFIIEDFSYSASVVFYFTV